MYRLEIVKTSCIRKKIKLHTASNTKELKNKVVSIR